jgi:sialate O-acetylesterase
MKGSPVFLAALLAILPVRADVKPASLFQDHAVLQQGRPLPIWGAAEPGELVSVTYSAGSVKETASTTADPEGSWKVLLPALPTSADPGTLEIRGKNTVTLSNVLVGEVWLASGQSNMEWPVKNAGNPDEEIADATDSLIRVVKVMHLSSEKPVAGVGGKWQVSSPATAGAFSAVAFSFARELRDKLGADVPVGIIDSSWGGTPIEAWMSGESLADPKFAAVGERWANRVAGYPAAKEKYETELAAWTAEEAAAKSTGAAFSKKKPAPPFQPYPHHMPAGLYNGMIHPLRSYAVRGIVWYQGETNVGRADEYRLMFPELIASRRKDFGQPDLPFYWVQLASFGDGNAKGVTWPLLREAQNDTLAVPHTGQAVAIDIGELSTVHPPNKRDVGIRLARLALRRTYGHESVVDAGPGMAKVEKASGGTFLVQFDQVADGLKNTNAADPAAVLGFEVAGSDKKFQPASAKITSASTVTVTPAGALPEPLYVRYAWRNFPENTLVNSAGLPAVPFRTDPR